MVRTSHVLLWNVWNPPAVTGVTVIVILRNVAKLECAIGVCRRRLGESADGILNRDSRSYNCCPGLVIDRTLDCAGRLRACHSGE